MIRSLYSLRFMFTILLASACCWLSQGPAQAQEQAAEARGLTADEYKIAQEVKVADLDNDTYVKTDDGKYVLDRYEMKPPYFITGDSGIKKRMDLYTFVDRESMQELALVVFFTNTEANETFNLVIPNMVSAAEVWNMYFDDIHAHDKKEQDVALKMSYILSKEVAYLIQKSSGVDVSAMDKPNADYDFCFPATAQVLLSDGSHKAIADVQAGDMVATYQQGQLSHTVVTAVAIHKQQNIRISRVLLVSEETVTAAMNQPYQPEVAELLATANHPVLTTAGKKSVGELQAGDVLYHVNRMTQTIEKYSVHFVQHGFDNTQEVYNLSTKAGGYVVGDMVVLDK